MVLVEDSSSVSVNHFFGMVIRSVKQTLPGVYKITSDAGSAFFLRSEYLSLVEEHKLLPFGYGRLDINEDDYLNAKEGDMGFFTQEEEEDLLEACEIYKVEKAAVNYIARAEQCRFNLYTKLVKKGFDKNRCNKVLDFLEKNNYLDDYRFASAWLRCRSLNHYEGRTRLSSELASRGIGNDVIKKVLDDYFAENDEEEICTKAYRKLLRLKKQEEKIYSSLVTAGFSYKLIKKVLNDFSC